MLLLLIYFRTQMTNCKLGQFWKQAVGGVTSEKSGNPAAYPRSSKYLLCWTHLPRKLSGTAAFPGRGRMLKIPANPVVVPDGNRWNMPVRFGMETSLALLFEISCKIFSACPILYPQYHNFIPGHVTSAHCLYTAC